MTILCAKRSKKDEKVYAIAREQVLPKRFVYGIVCLNDEGGDKKFILPVKYSNLSYIRKRFKNIKTGYGKGG